jgi:predicted PurR-regulated permease PerM
MKRTSCTSMKMSFMFESMILHGRFIQKTLSDPFLRILQATVLVSAILYFGRALFIPLSFALLLSFVLYPVCSLLERKGMSRLGATLIAVFFLMLLGSGVVILLVQQFLSFLKEWPVISIKLEESLQQVSRFISEYYSISKQQQQDLLKNLANQSSGSLLQLIRQTISAYSISMVLLILVPVFAALILYYRSLLLHVLFLLFPKENRQT